MLAIRLQNARATQLGKMHMRSELRIDNVVVGTLKVLKGECTVHALKTV